MKTIWKYELKPQMTTTLNLPVGAEILSAHSQGHDIFVWILVDDGSGFNQVTEIHEIYVIPTGRDASKTKGAKFVDTVHLTEERLVFHIFTRRI